MNESEPRVYYIHVDPYLMINQLKEQGFSVHTQYELLEHTEISGGVYYTVGYDFLERLKEKARQLEGDLVMCIYSLEGATVYHAGHSGLNAPEKETPLMAAYGLVVVGDRIELAALLVSQGLDV